MQAESQTPDNRPTDGEVTGKAPHPKRILLAYFSHAGENWVSGGVRFITVGNTKRLADTIAARLRASGHTVDCFEIQAEVPYSTNYDETTKRAEAEAEANERPAIRGPLPDASRYDVLFLGYPMWCGKMPRVLMTFLEAMSFGAVPVYPFTTHEGGGINASEREVLAALPDADVKPGFAMIGSHVDRPGQPLDVWLEAFEAAAAK